MSEDLILLEKREQELRIIMLQIKTINGRIEVQSWQDTKRLLSVSFTQIQLGQLALQEAIEDHKRVPSPRYGN